VTDSGFHAVRCDGYDQLFVAVRLWGGAMRSDLRLDRVEIKVTFGAERTAAAVRALELSEKPSDWRIYFCEDVNAGVGAGTPLLDLGVVMRARLRPDDDDATIKLRPCRRSQLDGAWLKRTDDLKLEADWAGDRHVLAASFTEKVKASTLEAVARHERSLTELFTDRQRAFLVECAGAAVNVETLTLLGPIGAAQWKTLDAAPPGLHPRAERWTFDTLDFLELSIAVPLEEAQAQQQALNTFVSSLGLQYDRKAETKTRMVLDRLVRAALSF
jgi:hypothetical protein